MRALALAPLLLALPALAQEVVSERVDGVQLTIYPDDLALVTETRTVDLPRGRSTVRFSGVSDRIVPQSLVLRAFEGVSLERNFDYDLLGRAALFEASVGEAITLSRIDRGSGEVWVQDAEVVSARPDGGVVVKTDEGLEGLFCSGLAERASFGGLPPGLRARPAMTIEVEAESAGPREVVVSYLTSGLGWEADYRLDLGEGEDEGEGADLLGWLSLRNGTATGYAEAELAVVAGDLRRGAETRGVRVSAEPLEAVCYPLARLDDFATDAPAPTPPPPQFDFSPLAMAESAMVSDVVVTATRVQRRQLAKEERLGDYKLYRIPRRVSVAPYQTKQVAFLDSEAEVAAEYVLSLDGYLSDAPRPLPIRYRVPNDQDGPLARALPAGEVRVFAPSATRGLAFVGGDRLEDTPVGQDAKVVAGTSTIVFYEAVRQSERADTIRLTNAGEGAATVVLSTRSADTRVSGARRDAGEDFPTWRVTVPAGGEAEVTVRRQ